MNNKPTGSKTRAHTPGPWHYQCTNAGNIGSKDKVRVEAADGHVAIACRIKRTEQNTFGNVGVRRNLAEVKANARLIAAAPDLLEAAMEIDQKRWQDKDGNIIIPIEAVKLIRAAILKAEQGA